MAGGGGESPHRGTKHWRGDLGPPRSLPRTSKYNDHYHFHSSDDPLPIYLYSTSRSSASSGCYQRYPRRKRKVRPCAMELHIKLIMEIVTLIVIHLYNIM